MFVLTLCIFVIYLFFSLGYIKKILDALPKSSQVGGFIGNNYKLRYPR
jgi:hypothetical protein